MIVIEWKDKHVSLNQWYAGKHWTVRTKLKDEWMVFFLSLFSKFKKQKFDKFQIDMYHNTRLDQDNCIPMIKLCSDFMKKNGWCEEDDKRYFKKLSIQYDELLPKNGIKLIISEV